MANDPSPPPRAGLSLYANLLNPSPKPGATISAAPVSYKQESSQDDEAAKKQQALAGTYMSPSLRFQPTKRPQPQNAVAAKAKAKAIASKFSAAPTAAEATPSAPSPTEQAANKPEAAQPKSTIADWTATADDDDWFAYGEKRQRGGRKKRKKNKEALEVFQNWDDIYDPSRPNNYEKYKHSEEKIREVREWKDLLYSHRMKRQSTRSPSEEDERPTNRRFAPPMSFAPPSNLNDETPPPRPADVPNDTTGDGAYARQLQTSQPPPPPADVPDDATGEDAYARRLRLSQQPPPPPPPATLTPPPPADISPPPPPPPPPGQITRAPVRYSFPAPPDDIPISETEFEEKLADSDQPKSSRPGQAGFAERLLSKYGWSKGQGLGAKGTGITNPLYAKVDKRKKRSDAEGGGFVTPASTGKILGGTKSKSAQDEEGKFGAMSEVIRLENMLDGMDLDEELTRGEGGIMQEIGEECGDKYGSVERVYIHHQESPLVFVQFVSQLSGLRAVNALEGRVFGGNTITARFWPKEKFDSAEYE